MTTSNQIFAGAGGSVASLADFNGSSNDNTVHPIPTNPPCIIIFNGSEIKNCNPPPPPPPPPVPPSPSSTAASFPFVVPGMDSSSYNLSSDAFFLPDFLDESYFRRNLLFYVRKGGAVKTSDSDPSSVFSPAAEQVQSVPFTIPEQNTWKTLETEWFLSEMAQ